MIQFWPEKSKTSQSLFSVLIFIIIVMGHVPSDVVLSKFSSCNICAHNFEARMLPIVDFDRSLDLNQTYISTFCTFVTYQQHACCSSLRLLYLEPKIATFFVQIPPSLGSYTWLRSTLCSFKQRTASTSNYHIGSKVTCL